MEQSIQEILKTIDDAINKFQGKMPGIQKMVYEELQPMLKEIQIKDGKLLNNIENLKLIGSLKNKLEKIIISADYKKSVERFIESFTSVSNLQQNYFSQFNKQYKPKKTLPFIKQLAVESTINSLMGQGMSDSIIEPIQKILNQNITTGGNYASFQEQLRNHILRNDTGEGSLERYTKQITTDSINQYNAQYHETIAQDLQFNWGRYVGSNITTSREFCILLTKKQWVHKSQLPDIIKGHIDDQNCKLSKTTGLPIGMIPGTDVDNFKVRRGGYQCGHQFFWVPDSAVPEEIKRQFIEPKTPNTNKIDFKILKAGGFGDIFSNSKTQAKLSTVHKELSKEQKTAVFGYSGHEYYDLNKVLRGDKKTTPYIENYKELLSQAVDNFKDKHVGWVFRGARLDKEHIAKYQDAFNNNSTIQHDFFTSTSHTIGSEFSGNMKYSIYSKRGVLIEKLSDHSHEKEVLLNAGTKFKILSMREKEGITYIKMEEI